MTHGNSFNGIYEVFNIGSSFHIKIAGTIDEMNAKNHLHNGRFDIFCFTVDNQQQN